MRRSHLACPYQLARTRFSNMWPIEACVQNLNFLPILSGMCRIAIITQRQQPGT